MTGSLRWFTYVDDAGTDWALFGDESNIEAANSDTGSGGSPANQNYKYPSNLKPRFAVYGNSDGSRNIRVPILTQSEYNALDNTSTIPDVAGGSTPLRLVRKRPEIISPLPTAADTGQNDGDGASPPPP